MFPVFLIRNPIFPIITRFPLRVAIKSPYYIAGTPEVKNCRLTLPTTGTAGQNLCPYSEIMEMTAVSVSGQPHVPLQTS